MRRAPGTQSSRKFREAGTTLTLVDTGTHHELKIGNVDRKSTRLNSSHTVIYTLSLHDALPIYASRAGDTKLPQIPRSGHDAHARRYGHASRAQDRQRRSEEHTSELQSHRDLHSFPTRRSSDLCVARRGHKAPANSAKRARRSRSSIRARITSSRSAT